MAHRFSNNPLITPESAVPTHPDWEVLGTFNPGAFRMGDQINLLVRVTERPKQVEPERIRIPMLEQADGQWQLTYRRFSKSDPNVDWQRDPRFLYYGDETFDVIYSHLRIARSADGKHFHLDDKPTFCGEEELTLYGIHDARVLNLDGIWQVLYTGNSHWGTPAFRATTEDFVSFEPKGVLFPPDNKDIALFPEKIYGRYYALHRPAASYFESFNIWLAESENLDAWGGHTPLLSVRRGHWDGKRIGCGAEPIKTSEGWLELYHGSDGTDYHMGAFLLDLENPRVVKARSAEPFLSPETEYEKNGFFSNVVFSNGHVMKDENTLYVYYGGADRVSAGLEITLGELFDTLR